MFLPQSDEHCYMLTMLRRALLVKLYYHDSKNAEVAVREFRLLKKQWSEPMSLCAFTDMIMKFEWTGQLGVLPWRGSKMVTNAVVEDFATEVVEACTESPHEILNVRFHLPWYVLPTVRYIMRRILNFYPCESQTVQQLEWHEYSQNTTLLKLTKHSR